MLAAIFLPHVYKLYPIPVPAVQLLLKQQYDRLGIICNEGVFIIVERT